MGRALNIARAWGLATVFGWGVPLYAAKNPVPTFAPEEIDPEQVAVGRRIYLEGVLPSGELLRGLVQGDVPVSGEQVTCVSCHRRSGLSSSEAGKFVQPVAGIFLYQPQEVLRKELFASRTEGPGTRPAYNDESLIEAIQKGVDPAGRVLDPLMPRYMLSDEDLRPLIAYLKTLSVEPSPGITEDAMHFATLVGEGVDEVKRKAMLDVLNTYFRDKNAETRHETGRSERAPWHKDWVYQAYRKWVLHVWELKGPEETWRAQLDEYYRQQPVFAVLSGIAGGDWRPIHAFCEATEVPCLFPTTDLPEIADQDFYSIYFSKGLILEAEALASYLASQAGAFEGSILQVYRDDDGGRIASGAFREATKRLGIMDVEDRAVGGAEALGGDYWRDLLEQKAPSILVLWLTSDDVAKLDAAVPGAAALTGLYLSASLLDRNPPQVGAALRGKVYLAYPFALPGELERLLARPRAWLRAKDIPVTDERVQANTHFAVMLAGASIKHIINNFSREYLIERIEHRVDNALTSSVYPRVSLAPDQRFASKGCYIVRLADGEEGGIAPVSDWIVP